jgi:hypothetical protein
LKELVILLMGMEGKKQTTAVDILYKFLYEMKSFEGFDPCKFKQEDVFKKAKEMEKEQIMDAWNDGWTESSDNSKQYYNETFKQ